MTEADLSSPWLLLGKGPSFAQRHRVDWPAFRTLGLNHVVRVQPVDVAHAIDIEVVQEVGAERLCAGAGVLVMPWHPHVGCRATSKTLADWTRELAALDMLSRQGRLLWYRLETGRRFPEQRPGPVVPVRCFSAEAALFLLAEAGVRTVRTLGIDGGCSYAPEFADLVPLTNGQISFDDQTQPLAEIVNHYGLDCARYASGGTIC